MYNMIKTKSSAKELFFSNSKKGRDFFINRPRGTAGLIQQRIAIKSDFIRKYNVNYINMVLNPDDRRFNKEIVEEFLLYMVELMIEQQRISALFKDARKSIIKNVAV